MGIFDALIFGLAVILFFTVPGMLLVKNLKLSFLTRSTLSTAIGIAAFTLLSFVLASFNLRFLMLPIIIITDIFSIFIAIRNKSFWPKRCPNFKKYLPLLILIIIAGILQLPAVITSGVATSSGGLNLYFANHQDGAMHLGIMNFLVDHFPPMRPEISTDLTNYHYFADLCVAEFSRLTHLPIALLFFQLFPILICVLTTILIYEIVIFTIQSNKKTTTTATFPFIVTFTFLLAGDGGYLMSLLFQHTLGWSLSTYDNGADQFLNMPHAFAKLIFLAAIFLLLYLWRKKEKRCLIPLILTASSLILFKVYFAFLIFGGWAASFVPDIITTFRSFNFKKLPRILELIALIIATLFAFLILRTTMSNNNSGFYFTPLVFPRQYIGLEHLNWNTWWLERQVFEDAHNVPRLIFGDIQIIFVALIVIYGLRLFGFFPLKKTRELLGARFLWFFLPGMLIFTAFGLNFMQTVGKFNTYNFFIITTLGLNFILGFNLASLWEKKNGKGILSKILVILIFIFIAPRTIRNTIFYLDTAIRQPKTVGSFSANQLALFNYLEKNTPRESIVQVTPKNHDFLQVGIISALANRRTYLTGIQNLEAHNADLATKENLLADAFSSAGDSIHLSTNLSALGIDYLYLTPDDLREYPLLAKLPPLFQNDAGAIIALE